MKVAISGATGLIGTALRESLAADGVQIVALSRKTSVSPLQTIAWDVENGRFDASPLEQVDAVVHLAGEPIAQRWNEARKKAIRDSRVKSTRLLVEGLKSLTRRPRVLVSGSAIGFYGERGDEVTLGKLSPGIGLPARDVPGLGACGDGSHGTRNPHGGSCEPESCCRPGAER